MKSVLVTGGMGFIGSNFVLHLLEKHPRCRIFNLDLLTYAGDRDNLPGVGAASNHHFIRGDIGDRDLLERVMQEGIEAVVHFAAESHVDRSIQDPQPFVQTNVQGTQILLEAARRHGVKKFVHISTDEVYGSLGNIGRFTENSPLYANSPYAASKAAADLFVRAYIRTFDLPAVITRCSNNFGPRQHQEKFIPMVITRALRDMEIPLYGDGMNVRDWLFVADHCAAVDLVLQNGQPGEIYNIGGNREMTNLAVALKILAELGKPETLIRFVSDRPGHDRRYAIDAAKISRELGWTPSRDFDRAIRETIQWYADHCEWWKKRLQIADTVRKKGDADNEHFNHGRRGSTGV